MSAMLTTSTARPSRGFTIIELLVVISIIIILAALAFPGMRALTKSNDQSQALNVVRTMVSTARNIAISQHRRAGVVFFEESQAYSSPANDKQTAMQLIVEDYDQTLTKYPGKNLLTTVFVYYSKERQYLPKGVKLATLSDEANTPIRAGENVTVSPSRVILFDADGQLTMMQGIAAPEAVAGMAGSYPTAYGDWKLLRPQDSPTLGGANNAYSSPGFILYNKLDFDQANLTNDTAANNWLVNHADVVIVNTFTGNINR